MKTYTESEVNELLKRNADLPDEFEPIADTIHLVRSKEEPSTVINGQLTVSSIAANIYGDNDNDGYLVIVEEHLDESNAGKWRLTNWVEELGRFGPFETLEQAQEFVTRFEPIFKTEYGGEFANISLGTEPAEGWSPGGGWNIHCYQDDQTQKWFSCVEFEPDNPYIQALNYSETPQPMSDLLGPFEYVNQALIMALAESFEYTKKYLS